MLIGVGTEQMRDDLVTFERIVNFEKSWSTILGHDLFNQYNGTAYVSLITDNKVCSKLYLLRNLHAINDIHRDVFSSSSVTKVE